MGNLFSFSIPLDQSVNNISQWLAEKRGYTRNLKKNLAALETTMEDLKAKQEDFSRRLKREENRGLQRLAKFQVWLNRVDIVEKKVNTLLSDRDVELQRLCLCGFCSSSLLSSYRYSKKVLLTLGEAEELKSKVFEVIAEEALASAVEERPLQLTIVGQETMLDKAWNHLKEAGVGVMGMYGMGGVGKTTLLTQINNKFSIDRGDFEYVIWVAVSKELHVEKILDEIAQKVDIGGEQWNQKDKIQKSIHLYNFMKKKKFVLFLDDIWEKVDLAHIGVPAPTRKNQCKVAFTTRSQDVCARMGVEDPMEVKCLMEDDAFDLFQKKVGQKTLGSDPEIFDLANIVAKKCCGLPLALNVIGETMSSIRTVQEWRDAIKVLNSYASEFSGMEKILPLLKYSYDSLMGEQVKSCLLYCALFPEDARLPREKLIEYWISEDIIDGTEGIERAEDKGYEIIGSLVRASLLSEDVDEFGKDALIMHDVVREMAIWIASELGNQKEAFIVHAGVGLCKIPKVINWDVVRRMSLMENKIPHLLGCPKCPKLTTLLLQKAGLRNISGEFFKYMPKLVALDVSYQELSELPEEISELVSLQYLNLSNTSIRHLPKGLQELKKLIHLDLEETKNLESIDGILSCLHNMKVLKLAHSLFQWDLDTVKELETLEHLEILTTTINPDPEQFLSSHRLMSRTRFLEISRKKDWFPLNRHLESSGISLSGTMDKLRVFNIFDCSISEIKTGSFLSLVEMRIQICDSLRELTFLMLAPNLRILEVQDAKQLEDIIKKDEACRVGIAEIVPFQKLKELRLVHLPKLKNIYWDSLPFPCLERITVKKCPNLRKLPFNSVSGMQRENGCIISYAED